MRIAMSLTAAAILAGCAGKPAEIAVAPAPLPAPVAASMPVPPAGAAKTLTIPVRLADGSFATPNRALSPAATLWHLRAALNVAALGCGDAALPTTYNAFLARHRSALAAAHREMQAQNADFDTAMTRLYNYFALPPATPGFCKAAIVVAGEAAIQPAADIAQFVPPALALIDAPFVAFFAQYDEYRVRLASWQAGDQTPRLSYDTAVVLGEGPPLRRGGAPQVAAR